MMESICIKKSIYRQMENGAGKKEVSSFSKVFSAFDLGSLHYENHWRKVSGSNFMCI